MTNQKVMKLALEALEDLGMKHFESTGEALHKEVFDVLKEALAKQEQGEPVAFKDSNGNTRMTVDASAPVVIDYSQKLAQQRTWVGLDPEEIRKTNHHMVDGAYHYSFKQGAEWAEAKLKEKNT